MKNYTRIYGNVDPELKNLTIAVCFPETRFSYSAKHLGKYDVNTKGICGIKTYWIDKIPEITKHNINTLYAGSLVIKYYLDKYNGNLELALKKYKGSITNMDPVNKVYDVLELLGEDYGN